jgi:hypothetical protein
LRRHHLPQRSDFGQQLHDQRLELGRVQRIRVERQWHPQVESQNRRKANRKMSAAAETAPTCDVFDSLDLAATCDARDFAGVTNPVENIWEYMRKNWFGHQVWPSYKAVVDACCEAWNKLMRMPERIASLTRRRWAAITVSG